MYLLTESLSDTITTYIVLKRLVKPWNEWEAFKLGLIDDKGNKLKTAISSEERAVWTVLDRFVWNIKRIMNKFVGQSKLAFMLSAAYLLKDSLQIYYKHNSSMLNEELNDFDLEKQKKIFEVLKKIDDLYIINESIDNIELNIYKHYQEVEKIIDNNYTLKDFL